MKQSSLFSFLSSNKKADIDEKKELMYHKAAKVDKPPSPVNKELRDIEEAPKRSRLKKIIDSDDENFKQDIEDFKFNFSQTKSAKKEEVKMMSMQKEEVMDSIKKEETKKSKVNKQVTEKKEMTEKKEIQESAVKDDFDDSTPEWAKVGQSRDKDRRLHGTSEADPTTLYIPPNEFKQLTNSMQQYWTIKAANFDKIIFFKLGKFYELFYEDALIGHKYLELNWMGRKMHTGFPEKVCSKYAKQLLEFGFKVAIVDQVETPEAMQRRVQENRKSGVGNIDKIVNRELSHVLTKGTYLYGDGEEITPDERFLLVIRKKILSSTHEQYGVVMLERQTNAISLAFVDNEEKNYQELKTLLLRIKPIEVVVDNNNIRSDDVIIKMLKSDTINCSVTCLAQRGDNWDHRKALFKLNGNTSEAIQHFSQQELVLSALSGLFSYLNQILILDRVLDCARYKIYDIFASQQLNMILDSQALYHLEILYSEGSKKKDMSLFGVINRTVTPVGYRLLKRWLTSPLFKKDLILERQQSVKDINRFRQERDLFRASIKQLPDLERMCSRVYEYSVKSSSKAIFYEDLSLSRLKEFRILCQKLRLAQEEILRYAQLKENFTSQRLYNLLTYEDKGGFFSNVIEFLDDFENYITWENDVPKPIKGVLESYDNAVINKEAIEGKLNEVLASIRKEHFKNDRSVQFAHAKSRYEVEVPIAYVENIKPNELEFTSQRQGYKRFHTRQIKDLVTDLEEAELKVKEELTTFVQFIFKNFKTNQRIWDQLILVLAELDALCSLSVFSETADGNLCWPEFVDEVKLEITNGRHPQLTNINYVPNTIEMSGDHKFLLLTGPNMGGKSTTLRMTCVLTILAQMGCMVPAEAMILSPVDRIFTRIGAKDNLIEGKSTFYVELEETLLPVTLGTQHSLFITDELGRGTSTYDGVAIASAVMKHMIERVNCRVIFATHFRILVEEAKQRQGVANVHMASYVDNDRVIFLYRLRNGECPASFGINVAKAVGINESIVKKAQEMADQFEKKALNPEAVNKAYLSIIDQLY